MEKFETPPVETLAIYQVYADYIRHENDLLNHRTTWFVAIETVLVAGAAYLLLRYFESAVSMVFGPPDAKLPHIIEFVIAGFALCSFGLVTALAARRSIKAAIASQCALDAEWRVLCGELPGAAILPDMMGGKCTDPAAGQHFADRLVDTVLCFWASFLIALVTLSLIMLMKEKWGDETDLRTGALTLAGLIGGATAVVHGLLVQRLMVRPLQALANADERISKPIRRLVPALMHFSTFGWLLGGLVLIAAANAVGAEGRLVAGLFAGTLYLFGAAVNAWATRGRHPGWMLMAMAIALIALGIA